MAHFTQLYYHLVFSTKDRLPLISSAFEPKLHSYLGGIVTAQRGVVLEINGMPDHVHLLVSLPPTVSISKLLKDVKGSSSHWAEQQKEDVETFGWQKGYGAFTVSASQRDKVRRYIQNQKIRHQNMTYEEEMEALIQRHH